MSTTKNGPKGKSKATATPTAPKGKAKPAPKGGSKKK